MPCMSKETLIVIVETLECEGHILKSTEFVNKQTIQLNVSTKTYHIYLNILSEKLGGRGDHRTINTFWTCSVQVFLWELKLVKRGYLKCRLILCSGKYSACPVNAISFNDPKTQYLNQMINDEMFAFRYFLLIDCPFNEITLHCFCSEIF